MSLKKWWVYHITKIRHVLVDVCNAGSMCSEENHEEMHVEVCQWEYNSLEQNLNFLSSIITCHERWIRHYSPQLKRQSRVWKTERLAPMNKFYTMPSSGKVMLTLVLNFQSIILQQCLPQKLLTVSELH